MVDINAGLIHYLFVFYIWNNDDTSQIYATKTKTETFLVL